ncbi:type II secretion system protein [bacterium]|nr:MAG: type II secretion system protein [bacterium]
MKRWRGQHGFTLLEVMVSLAIVGGLLMTLIYTLNYNLGITEKLFAVTNMTNLAKEKLEEMETKPRETEGNFPAPYEALNYETKVRDSAFPEIMEIAVTVGDGKTRVMLSELIRETAPSLVSRADGTK